MAKENAQAAGMLEHIEFKQCDVLQAPPPASSGYLVSNPPYGERLGEYVGLLPIYDGLGKHLKAKFKDWHVSLLSSEPQLLKALKLRATKRYALNNGKLECSLANYVLDDANVADFSEQGPLPAEEFANRLVKNQKRLQKWLKRENIEAYRIYDADLPHYNFAIDVYGEWVIVQEYAPPKSLAKRIAVSEYGAKFLINPADYLDVGLFLDHRITRQMFARKAKGKHVLNLFCYTGSVSVHAALQGASSVTSIDMSRTYINWAKDNFELNKVQGKHVFEQADCLEWIAARASSGLPKFDAIGFTGREY